MKNDCSCSLAVISECASVENEMLNGIFPDELYGKKIQA